MSEMNEKKRKTMWVISALGRCLYFFDMAPLNTCATYLGVCRSSSAVSKFF